MATPHQIEAAAERVYAAIVFWNGLGVTNMDALENAKAFVIDRLEHWRELKQEAE